MLRRLLGTFAKSHWTGLATLCSIAVLAYGIFSWIVKDDRADDSVPFSVRDRVRCPRGGDLLGRERNRREGAVEFEAPEGRAIAPPVVVEVHAENDGGYDPIEYRDHLDGKPTSVRVKFWCDPDNFPGAGGGWMEIEIHGSHIPR